MGEQVRPLLWAVIRLLAVVEAVQFASKPWLDMPSEDFTERQHRLLKALAELENEV